jgi:hypothetical protein
MASATAERPKQSIPRRTVGMMTAIDRTYPRRETAAAIGYVQDGHARRKVVIAV